LAHHTNVMAALPLTHARAARARMRCAGLARRRAGVRCAPREQALAAAPRPPAWGS